MYFNSLTLYRFWKKIDTNAPIHSNNQKRWFYSIFRERDIVYCVYPPPPSQNVFKSGELLLETISSVKTTCWENKEFALCSKRVFFATATNDDRFNFKTLPKKIVAPGKIFISILQQAFKLPKMSVYISLVHSNGKVFSLWVGGLLVQQRMYKIWVQEMI